MKITRDLNYDVKINFELLEKEPNIFTMQNISFSNVDSEFKKKYVKWVLNKMLSNNRLEKTTGKVLNVDPAIGIKNVGATAERSAREIL